MRFFCYLDYNSQLSGAKSRLAKTSLAKTILAKIRLATLPLANLVKS